jgi:ribosomal protein S25
MSSVSEKEDKLLVRRDTLNLRRKYGRTKRVDVIERDAFVPRGLEDDIKEYILNRKAILATDISVKYDIRVSTVKKLLEKYEEEGLIELYDPSLKLDIYVPVS